MEHADQLMAFGATVGAYNFTKVKLLVDIHSLTTVMLRLLSFDQNIDWRNFTNV